MVCRRDVCVYGCQQLGLGIDQNENEGKALRNLIPKVAPLMSEYDNMHPRFAVMDEPDRHIFSSKGNSAHQSDVTRVISKEWSVMNDTVPERIYFRGYSSRMDLQRFLIIGASETIYYNSYFLFDMQLSTNYPQTPPSVLMHAFNMRINPNLYAEGKVCLSLLGTWAGQHHVENWDPKHSNILQVATSVQGLILGQSEPYYNEPGIDKRVNNAPESMQYSREAAVMSIQILMNMVDKPLKEFTEIVRDHFRTHCEETLRFLQFCYIWANEKNALLKPVMGAEMRKTFKNFRLIENSTDPLLYSGMASKLSQFKTLVRRFGPPGLVPANPNEDVNTTFEYVPQDTDDF
jgi:ubiquitin-protein ligase